MALRVTDTVALAQLGLGAIGNLLSLPRQIQAQQAQNEVSAEMLSAALGIPIEEAQKKVGTAQPSWLAASQEGVGGKVLGGVGDIGTIISSLVGQPVKAPRIDVGEMATAANLKEKREQRQRLAQIPWSDPRAQKFAAAGDYETAAKIESKGTGEPTLWGTIDNFLHAATPEEREAAGQMLGVYGQVQGTIAGQRAATMEPYNIAREGRAEAARVAQDERTAERQRRMEAHKMEVRVQGALAIVDQLDAAVDSAFTADSIPGIPVQAVNSVLRAKRGDESVVAIRTGTAKIGTIIEALQRDGRISDQDANYMLGQMPNLNTDTKPEAKAKLKVLRDAIVARLRSPVEAMESPSQPAPPTPSIDLGDGFSVTPVD